MYKVFLLIFRTGEAKSMIVETVSMTYHFLLKRLNEAVWPRGHLLKEILI
jgi:hypothetical protein